MSNIFNENSGEGTSGYTNDLDKEIGNAAPINIESNFVNITPLYVSASGHTRLFTATRYGKIYVLKGLKPDFMYTLRFIGRLLLKNLKSDCNSTILTYVAPLAWRRLTDMVR